MKYNNDNSRNNNNKNHNNVDPKATAINPFLK